VIAVGVQTWGTDVAALRRYWAAADALGFARITYGDGLGDFTHDGWSMLGALAVVTRRARIGPAVTYAFDPSSHHAAWLAKRAVAVDHLSAGRLDLRLAVGAEDEDVAASWQGLGVPYPPARTRLRVLEESVRILRALWSADGPIDYHGRVYQLRRARLRPAPLQRGGPPIWIAAMGPRALALAAAHADGWEASFLTPAAFGERWERLRALARDAGREPGDLRRAVELDALVAGSAADRASAVERFCAARAIDRRHPLLEAALVGEAGSIAARIADYERAGATDLTLGFADFPATAMLEAFAARVLPALASPTT
jgi:alkanesulfonate monooxygenase SsuD/methylene tetrahydromethanopterin reductase-like flavin-dependent oxidoreductase (luciferase family)